MEKVETLELQTAKEVVSAINKLLNASAGEQIYRAEIQELFKTLKLLNNPLFSVDMP